MRTALATALVLLSAAPAAPAATVARTVPAVGPVLAGDRVAWGVETRDGRLRVMRGAPAEAAIRVPRATARRTRRGFYHTPWALAASGEAVAALVSTDTSRRSGPDVVSTESVPAVLGGPWDAPALLSGAIPERADGPDDPGQAYPAAVAVDGRRVAVAESTGECGEADRIAVHEGDGVTAFCASSRVRDLALAGDRIAWTTEAGGTGSAIVIAEFPTGRVLRTIGRGTRRAFGFEDIDLDASGALAFTMQGPRFTVGDQRLAFLPRPDAPVRVIAHHAATRGIALAAGRVLYERYLDRAGRRSELVLRPVAGGKPRRLASFGPGRRRAGDVDSDGRRATWAVRGTHRRIVLRRL